MTEEQAKAYMSKLLTAMSRAGGSDLFISNEFPPSMKTHGTMRPMTSQKLSGEFTRQLADSLMNSRQREEFAKELEVQFRDLHPGSRAWFLRQRFRSTAARRHGDQDHTGRNSRFYGSGIA